MAESFFKRNQKKILAIFSAGLMVAFAIPSMNKNSGRGDIVYGNVRGGKVRVRDIEDAKAQLQMLRQMVYNDPDPRTGRFATVLDRRLGTAPAREMDAHPELFYLLWREAEEAGVSVPDDEVKSVLANTQFAGTASGEDVEARRQEAVRSLLMITSNADRAAKALHVSQPERALRVAAQQDIGLNLVEFKAADYASKVPQWDAKTRDEKAHQQYEKYKNQEPTTRPGNDFRFGYKIPNRVRVQAIGLPREKVKEVAGSKISEVEARKYYLQHETEFPVSPTSRVSHVTIGVPPTEYIRAPVGPQTRPTTQPTKYHLDFSYSYTTTIKLQDKHFEEYREEVFKRITDDRADKLARDILGEMNNQMTADYDAFRRAAPEMPKTATSMPSSFQPPKTSLGVPYDSYEYLQKLAARLQEKYGVLPVTYEDKGLRTQQELGKIEGLGTASIVDQNLNLQALMQVDPTFRYASMALAQYHFPVYATRYVQPLMDDETTALSRNFRLHVLNLFEPSPELQGRGDKPADNVTYVFRVAEAEPAHPAPEKDLTEKLVADARVIAAFELAEQDANKLLAEAQKTGLSSAAKAADKKLITTGMISGRNPDVAQYPMPDSDAGSVFVQQGYQLLTKGSGNPEHPVGIMEIKPTATVLVGEVNQLRPPWTPETLPAREAETQFETDQQAAVRIRAQWLSYADVVERMHFVGNEAPKKAPTNVPQDQERLPINPGF